MIVADASWLIALLDPHDAHHEAAQSLNERHSTEPVILHPVTLAECLVGPAKLGRLDDTAHALRSAFTIAEVDADAPVRWAELRATTPLRLPDAIVLDTAIAYRAGAVFTFDDRLAQVAISHQIDVPGPSAAS